MGIGGRGRGLAMPYTPAPCAGLSWLCLTPPYTPAPCAGLSYPPLHACTMCRSELAEHMRLLSRLLSDANEAVDNASSLLMEVIERNEKKLRSVDHLSDQDIKMHPTTLMLCR